MQSRSRLRRVSLTAKRFGMTPFGRIPCYAVRLFSAARQRHRGRKLWLTRTCGSSSRAWKRRENSSASPRKSIPCWRSPRSPSASRAPKVRRCSLSAPRARSSPCSSISLGSQKRLLMALEVDSYEEVADRIRGFLDMQAPQGLARQAQDAAEAGRARRVFSQDGEVRPVQGSHPPRQFFAGRISDPAVLAAGRRPLHHLAAGDHAQSRTAASATWASTACRCTTSAPRACTGRRRSTAPNISAAPAPPIPKDAWTWPWPSAPSR